MEKRRRKNANRFGVRTSRYETERLISVILSVYPWTPPVFLPPLSPSRDSIFSFCPFRVSFPPRSLPLPPTFLFVFPPHGISHSPSAPESCLQIRATGFPAFLAHPKGEHPPTHGHIYPSPQSFLVVWASSFSMPACSIDKDRHYRRRKVREGWVERTGERGW